MLGLTAPRIKQSMASANRKLNLEASVFTRSNDTITGALEGGKHLTRAELALALQQAGIETTDLLRLTHLVMQAELDGIICSGARRGKQFTYALLDERVSATVSPLTRAEALEELAKRYFQSHGPATVHDYSWWSGLTIADAKTGLESIKPLLLREHIDGQDYYFPPPAAPIKDQLSLSAYLLPNYDEYLVAYKDRTAAFEAGHSEKMRFGGNPIFNHVIIFNGQVAGTWKGNIGGAAGLVKADPFHQFNDSQSEAFRLAAERYYKFSGEKSAARPKQFSDS